MLISKHATAAHARQEDDEDSRKLVEMRKTRRDVQGHRFTNFVYF